MVNCKELTGKVIERASVFEANETGPQLELKFTDGTMFAFRFSNRPAIEARLIENEPVESVLLKDYSVPAEQLNYVGLTLRT
ncbi:MAG: hypothetical protein PW792_10650 [Acidobacteriaceae bacterium]|nr:hypothetical protein [Acidobacteriaceae bacterium]